MTLARVVQTCYGCPAQWDAWTTDGQYLYLRYRHGIGSVEGQAGPDPDTWQYGPHQTVTEWDDDTVLGEIERDDFLARAGLRLAPGAEVTLGWEY